ncbi:MAG: aspartate carbamoyltransferase [Candidatus Giovannonibacteria bacterium]|nr:aspartate carbamoyltransferase [Candidatus Giovannonibacteria bacterium]
MHNNHVRVLTDGVPPQNSSEGDLFDYLHMAKPGDIIEAQQFSRQWLEDELFPMAQKMETIVAKRGSSDLAGKKMINFFYEPSTRTRASFEIAMDMLGGRVIFSTENAADFSSLAKGEDIRDTILVLNRYRPDVIVLRSKTEGDAKRAAEISLAPIFNAGDGIGQHPTQAMLDLYTIKKKFGRIDGLSIAMAGDLSKGRTVRSLAYLLGKYSDVTIYLVSPEELKIRDDIKDYLRRHNVFFYEMNDLRQVAQSVDVIYQTRPQKERGTEFYPLISESGYFVINREITGMMKKDSIIMHPLPRNEEIEREVDKDHRAVYLTDQIDSGLAVRMALLKMFLG